MPYTAQDILKSIADLSNFLDKNFNALYAQCTTDDQRTNLRSVCSAARDAYWAAVAKSLTDNNPTVDKLTKSLNDTNAQVQAQLGNIKDIVAYINLCTNAVQLAASLATLAAAA
jgi:hypothetical protein